MTLASVPRYDERVASRAGEHAVVLGAGMAGLLAARVLADHFERVSVLERDPLPAEAASRRGTPQAEHVHALLEAGRVTLEDLFPGYCRAVRSDGGVIIDAATDFEYFHDGGFLADGQTRLPMLCASRPLLERVVRTRVSALEGVSLRAECQCSAYLTADDSMGVEGVRVTDASGADERVESDLVVDATGRASRTPAWLERHGYGEPPTDTVGIDLAYSTARLDRPAGDRRGFLIAPTPANPRGGTAVPVEGDRWIVTLFGLGEARPPTDLEGLEAFSRRLPAPELSDLLESQSVRSDRVSHYPFPSSRWHHYEVLEEFPPGLLVIGDAVASFNPIYGQGISVAALEALELHRALATAERSDLAGRYFPKVADIVRTIWWMTVRADFDFPETTGTKPRGTDLFNWYFGRLIQTAHSDGRVADAIARVLRLERSPLSLVHPRIALKAVAPFT